MASAVDIEDEGPVRVLTMRNEGKLNAFDTPMLDDLTAEIERADADDAVRVVVLTGAGRAFCAGGDTSAMGADPDPAAHRRFLLEHIHRVPKALRASGTPVIAMINGAAVGAGLDIALACDLRTCADGAVLTEGYIRAGLAAGDGGAWLLPRLIGAGRATEIFLTGRRIAPAEAVQIGLVTSIHEASALREDTITLARRLADNPPEALRAMKRLLHQSQSVGFETGLQLAADTVAILQSGDEHREAVARLRSR